MKKETLDRDLYSKYGIKKATAAKICADLGFAPTLKFEFMTLSQQNLYVQVCRTYFHGPRYKLEKKKAITELISKGCRRGLRLKNRLPVRGQRTRTNAKTIKRWKL